MHGALLAAGRELVEKGSGDRTAAVKRAWLCSQDGDFSVRRRQGFQSLCSPPEALRLRRVNKVSEAQRGCGPCSGSRRH